MKLYGAGLSRTTLYTGSLASLSATEYNQNLGANISKLYPVEISTVQDLFFNPVTTNKVDAITQPYIPNSYNLANYSSLVAAEQAKMLSFLQERIVFVKNDSDVAHSIGVSITDQSPTGTYIEASLFNETYSQLNGTMLGFVNDYGFAIDECIINHDSKPTTPDPAGVAQFANIPAGEYRVMVLRMFGCKDVGVPEDYVIIGTTTT